MNIPKLKRTPSNNGPCPCGSLKQYKRCHKGKAIPDKKSTKNKELFTVKLDEDIETDIKRIVSEIRENPEVFKDNLYHQVQEVVDLINSFSKIHLLGSLSTRLIQATPKLSSQLIEILPIDVKKDIPKEEFQINDEEIETILEYAISIATAYPDTNIDKIPTQSDVEQIRLRLADIKKKITLLDISKELKTNEQIEDNWLYFIIRQDSLSVRGKGYQIHVNEVYGEMFSPYDKFLLEKWGFTSKDLLDSISEFDEIVLSKTNSTTGIMSAHRRFTRWCEEKGDNNVLEGIKVGKHFMTQFIEDNPDLGQPGSKSPLIYYLDDIHSYPTIFWLPVLNEKYNNILNVLSLHFGDNQQFIGKDDYKHLPLNDTLVYSKPFIKIGDRHYHFSMSLAYRSIFYITESLILNGDKSFYNSIYRTNNAPESRDNFIERKTKEIFQKMLPNVTFYNSLDYRVIENGIEKEPELDLLGISENAIYIIEVKAGEFNSKQKRGDMKGLKEKLKETVNKGADQADRAKEYIINNPKPSFSYGEKGHKQNLTIEDFSKKELHKVVVSWEYLGFIALNQKELINLDVLSQTNKDCWLISLFDLMVFRDLVPNEKNFLAYLNYRQKLVTDTRLRFFDELDALGLFMKNIDLPNLGPKEKLHITNTSNDIDVYFDNLLFGIPEKHNPKPKFSN